MEQGAKELIWVDTASKNHTISELLVGKAM